MAKKSARQNARQFVLQVLYAWDVSGDAIATIQNSWDAEWDAQEPLDRAYAHQLLQKIPMVLEVLEAQILQHAHRPIQDMTTIERVILYLGVYELLHQPEIPYRVVLNECVNLAKEFGAEDGYKFVNRVLQEVSNATRNPEKNR